MGQAVDTVVILVNVRFLKYNLSTIQQVSVCFVCLCVCMFICLNVCMLVWKSLEKQLNGCYTRLLRMVFNVHWKEHVTYEELYGTMVRVTDLSVRWEHRPSTMVFHSCLFVTIFSIFLQVYTIFFLSFSVPGVSRPSCSSLPLWVPCKCLSCDACFWLPQCVSSVCVLSVCPQCVSSVCVLSVCPQCVSSVCVLSVCPQCVSSVCVLSVCPQSYPLPLSLLYFISTRSCLVLGPTYAIVLNGVLAYDNDSLNYLIFK